MDSKCFIFLQFDDQKNVLLTCEDTLRDSLLSEKSCCDETEKGRFIRRLFDLIEQCREQWGKDSDKELSWNFLEELTNYIAISGLAFINVRDERFSCETEDVSSLVGTFCLETKQYMPKTRSEVLRTLFESLVLEIRRTIKQYPGKDTGNHCSVYAGGFPKWNSQICQWIADAVQMSVTAVDPDSMEEENVFSPNSGALWDSYEQRFRVL